MYGTLGRRQSPHVVSGQLAPHQAWSRWAVCAGGSVTEWGLGSPLHAALTSWKAPCPGEDGLTQCAPRAHAAGGGHGAGWARAAGRGAAPSARLAGSRFTGPGAAKAAAPLGGARWWGGAPSTVTPTPTPGCLSVVCVPATALNRHPWKTPHPEPFASHLLPPAQPGLTPLRQRLRVWKTPGHSDRDAETRPGLPPPLQEVLFSARRP